MAANPTVAVIQRLRLPSVSVVARRVAAKPPRKALGAANWEARVDRSAGESGCTPNAYRRGPNAQAGCIRGVREPLVSGFPTKAARRSRTSESRSDPNVRFWRYSPVTKACRTASPLRLPRPVTFWPASLTIPPHASPTCRHGPGSRPRPSKSLRPPDAKGRSPSTYHSTRRVTST